MCFAYDIRLVLSWHVLCARENVFHRIFLAANAVRFVSFQFTLYSDTMHVTLKVVYAPCERVLNVKTGWADSSRRVLHFSEDAALKNAQ